ncbi:Putative peptidoglycan binding domain-containing protein [Actinopolyspora alba]|uniref:Putative peptidoglycan binding domain-containing protein n=1 Tax=Actinopolyspora alba TaxID=673379 RepID=A0A1I1ZUI0_9ACTN|nr:Putative peptidoglycan binding domain-containing protein [Actinopolyspora alba]
MFRVSRVSFVAVLVSLGLSGGIASAGAQERTFEALALPTCTISDSSVPATSSGDRDCVLAIGNANEAVEVLQWSLRYCNSQDIAVDGIYGPNTESAVENVQRAAGIAVDGVYGPETRRNMLWIDYGECV